MARRPGNVRVLGRQHSAWAMLLVGIVLSLSAAMIMSRCLSTASVRRLQ